MCPFNCVAHFSISIFVRSNRIVRHLKWKKKPAPTPTRTATENVEFYSVQINVYKKLAQPNIFMYNIYRHEWTRHRWSYECIECLLRGTRVPVLSLYICYVTISRLRYTYLLCRVFRMQCGCCCCCRRFFVVCLSYHNCIATNSKYECDSDFLLERDFAKNATVCYR